MGKIDLLIVPDPTKMTLALPLNERTREKERQLEELVRKIEGVQLFFPPVFGNVELPQEYGDLLATRGLAELARDVETQLKSRGIPHIVVRGLYVETEEDVKYVTSIAKMALEHKIAKEYGIPVTLGNVMVLKVPHYDEWKDPPEEGSALDWLWLAVGVAGAIAVPLLFMLKSLKNP